MAAAPKPGEFYAIQSGAGGLLTTTSRAYGAEAGTKERLRLARKINDHPLNHKFRRPPGNAFERSNFPDGIVSFSPHFTCGDPQLRAAKGEKKCYARLFIPPREELFHFQFGPAVPLPSEAGTQLRNLPDVCKYLDLGCLTPLDPKHIHTGKSDERRPVTNPIGGIPNRWICSLSAIIHDPLDNSSWITGLGTGVRIGPCHVLTAAHCLVSVTRRPAEPWRVTRAVAVGIAFGRHGLLLPEPHMLKRGAGKISSLGAFFVRGQDNFWVPPEWEELCAKGKMSDKDFDASAFDYGLIRFDPADRCASIAALASGFPHWGVSRSSTGFSDTSNFWSELRKGKDIIEMAGYPGDKPCQQWSDKGLVRDIYSVGKGYFQDQPKNAWVSFAADSAIGMSGAPIWKMVKGRRKRGSYLETPSRRVLMGVVSASQPTGIAYGAALTPFAWDRLRKAGLTDEKADGCGVKKR